MARFRLLNLPNNGHYLNTDPPTEWEQIEVDLKTGRQLRHRYKVPLYLDVMDPMTHSHPETGEIFLSTKADPAYPRDIVFIGPPTEGMEPLDDEASALLAKLPKGTNPMSEFALPSTGGFGPAPPDPQAHQLAAVMSALQAQNAVLVAQMEAMQRRIDDLATVEEALPPLPEASPELRL